MANISQYIKAFIASIKPVALSGSFNDLTDRPTISIVSVRDYGAVGDGITDDTQAFVDMATVTKYVYVPEGNYIINLTTQSEVDIVLESLEGMHVDGDITINILPGAYTRTTPLKIKPQNGGRISIKGANLISTTITAGVPSVNAVNITGNRYYYDTTLTVADASIFSIGDWVLVKTTGVDLTYTSYDETQNGARHNELDGFFEVTGVNTGLNTVTYRNTSRQSSNRFPGAGVIAAATATVTGGNIYKFPTVLKFNGCNGLNLTSILGAVSNIGIVGNSAGTVTSAVTCYDGGGINNIHDVGVANFTGPGIDVSGSGSYLNGQYVYSSGHGTHGYRVSGATVSLPYSIASGCGDTVGNGFFVTNGGHFYCSHGISNGVRNSGFISNRGSQMVSESCVSINNGNYDDEVAGGWSDLEGKGYESEAASTHYRSDSVALFMTALGFYTLQGSTAVSARCVSSGHLRSHGFYSFMGAIDSTRGSVAQNNAGRGFYAYVNSNIDAVETLSKGNALDYVAQGGARINALSYKTLSGTHTPTFNVAVNCSGANQIITSNTFEIGQKLILTKGANLTISSGIINVTNSYHIVDTEASAGTDDLVTINGGVDGMILVIRQLTSSRDIVIKSGVGNIHLAAANDITLSAYRDKIQLIYDAADNAWSQLSFADNA